MRAYMSRRTAWEHAMLYSAMDETQRRGAEALAEQEARRILAETEPGFWLSGGHRSLSVGPDWAGVPYIGRHVPADWDSSDVNNRELFALSALAESLARFIETEV